MTNSPLKYDLEERTAKFGERIVLFCKNLKRDPIIQPAIIQLIRSATSIGANYMEANGASSPKDFQNKIYICKKEAQETKHWLRMLAVYFPEHQDELRSSWKESQELTMIFHAIVSKLKFKNSLKIEN
jgi:four helix bundle protein